MTEIDRDSPVPIYHQLKKLIQAQIESGLWQPGDRIPTENELCQMYEISRSPVRQALTDLAYDGLLTRRPGLGTFVNHVASDTPPSNASIQMMSSDPYWSRVLDRVSRIWNAEHPNREIAFDVEIVKHSQFYDLLSTSIGSGAAPDVAMVDCVWVAGLAQSGFLYALDDPELGSSWNNDAFIEDLYPAFVEANSYKGQLYGLPVKADASLLWYRKDWFVEENLSPPQNWADVLSAVEHFQHPQVRERYRLEHVMAFPGGKAGGEATVYTLMPFVWSAGGDVFDPETGQVVLDTPETQRALQLLRELVNVHQATSPGVVEYGEDTAPWMLARGRVAMSLGGSYESEIILDESGWGEDEFAQRVGCVPPLSAPEGDSVPAVGGSSYVILRQCNHPAQVMMALRLATDPEIVGGLYCSMLQSSPRLSFDEVLNLETDESDVLLRQTSRMIASGRARPSIPEYFKVSHQLQAMFEAAISSAKPIDELTRRTAEFISVLTGRPFRSA
jgi:multiple sugar transport system substrate-binding protein